MAVKAFARKQGIVLTEKEQAWEKDGTSPPFGVSTYYASLITPSDSDDPIRRQILPTSCEMMYSPGESEDPLAEEEHSVTSRLIHRYAERVAFLVTDACAVYCRHCFRRRFTGTQRGPATTEDIIAAARYVGAHQEVKEILFTGGDMFTLSNEKIDALIGEFRAVRPDLIIRLCSRVPVVLPSRITDGLMAVMKKHSSAPFFLMVQFNHPRELTAQSREATARFIDAGIPVFNQSVLLRGVNDDAGILEELCNGLLAARIKPYYLFQGDLVEGTAHLRVPLEKGLALVKELRRRLSGLAMPVYAVDLPEGGGKVPVDSMYLKGRDSDGAWVFETPDGGERRYRDPEV